MEPRFECKYPDVGYGHPKNHLTAGSIGWASANVGILEPILWGSLRTDVCNFEYKLISV